MTDDSITLVTVTENAPVSAPVVQREVVTLPSETTIVVDSPVNQIVEIDRDTFIVASSPEINVITVGEQGPPGAAGTVLSPGVNTGDIIRYNTGTEAWEVAAEPFNFRGLVLTPALSSLVTAEGALYYNSTEKTVKVCTNI